MDIRDALRVLGIERLALGVHDANFPGHPDEDVGTGTPNGRGADDFFRFSAELGFDTIQLGPQGETSESDSSPYNGSAFSRRTLSIALGPLVEEGLLSEETRRRVVMAPSDRCDHVAACRAMRIVLDEVHRRLRERGLPKTRHRDQFALFDALTEANGGRDFTEWSPEIEPTHEAIDRFAIAQRLAHEQHAAMRKRVRSLGLHLYADLQIGWSRRELWAYRDCFMRDYRMGAPPSRTNPDGQPWGYPMLDPAAPEKVAALVDARFEKVAREYDGVRVDHPHGWICPWVYRIDDPDPLHAVQNGARLHESPDDPDLGRFAIARRDQLDRTRVPWDEHWVRELDDAQVARYASLLDRLIERVGHEHVLCEVLSTMPYPLGRVLERYHLGRFRVTQKVGLNDSRDVYRSENAAPADWIMVGNHDTAPIWNVAARWVDEGTADAHARYLEERLHQPVARDPASLARAKLAELFASPAHNVFVWWGDLLGETDWYNRPGTVNSDNWSRRIPPGFRRIHAERAAAGVAMDVRSAVSVALRARGHDDLARRVIQDRGA
jgi:4-alpha-glucanotransferase